MTEKQREYQREYRKNNKEMLSQKRKEYHLKWHDYFLKREKEIRESKDRIEYLKKYYEDNKEHRSKYQKEYYQLNKEEIKLKNKKYSCNNVLKKLKKEKERLKK